MGIRVSCSRSWVLSSLREMRWSCIRWSCIAPEILALHHVTGVSVAEVRPIIAISKPDKGNGVVLLKKADYPSSMTELFADRTKFRKLDKNNTLTQLTTSQTYLRWLDIVMLTNKDGMCQI